MGLVRTAARRFREGGQGVVDTADIAQGLAEVEYAAGVGKVHLRCPE